MIERKPEGIYLIQLLLRTQGSPYFLLSNGGCKSVTITFTSALSIVTRRSESSAITKVYCMNFSILASTYYCNLESFCWMF